MARNLRIHMTSEKHSHNMAALQRQQQQQSHQMRLQQQLNAAAVAALPPTGYHPSMTSLPWRAAQPSGPFLTPSTAVDLNGPCAQRSARVTTASQPGHYHHHHHHPQQVSGQTSSDGGGRGSGALYTCNLCPYRTSLRANFHLHCQTDKHAQRVRQLALRAPSVDVVPRPPSQLDPPRSSVDDKPGTTVASM